MIASTTKKVRRSLMRWNFTGLGFALMVLMAGPAEAGPIASIDGSVDLVLGEILHPTIILLDDFGRTVAGSTSDALGPTVDVLADGHADYFVYSAAGNGAVHAHTNIFFDDTDPRSLGDEFVVRASSSALLTIDDLVVNGKPGSLTTSLNLHLTGLLQVGSSVPYSNSIFNGGKPQTVGGAGVSVTAEVFGTQVMNGGLQLSSANGSSPTASGSGVLANFSGNDVLTTDPFTVTANTPFSLSLLLSASTLAGIEDGGAGNAGGSADFSHTLTFVDDRPVFNLPSGYTANSLEAGIVNNQFTPADGSPTIPEPSAMVLSGIGLSLLCFGRRWIR